MTEAEARAIAAPDSWPWPMSQDAQRWVRSVVEAQKPECERKFDRQAHDDFLRGL